MCIAHYCNCKYSGSSNCAHTLSDISVQDRTWVVRFKDRGVRSNHFNLWFTAVYIPSYDMTLNNQHRPRQLSQSLWLTLFSHSCNTCSKPCRADSEWTFSASMLQTVCSSKFFFFVYFFVNMTCINCVHVRPESHLTCKAFWYMYMVHVSS